jgi:hypothetical protein
VQKVGITKVQDDFAFRLASLLYNSENRSFSLKNEPHGELKVLDTPVVRNQRQDNKRAQFGFRKVHYNLQGSRAPFSQPPSGRQYSDRRRNSPSREQYQDSYRFPPRGRSPPRRHSRDRQRSRSPPREQYQDNRRPPPQDHRRDGYDLRSRDRQREFPPRGQHRDSRWSSPRGRRHDDYDRRSQVRQRSRSPRRESPPRGQYRDSRWSSPRGHHHHDYDRRSPHRGHHHNDYDRCPPYPPLQSRPCDDRRSLGSPSRDRPRDGRRSPRRRASPQAKPPIARPPQRTTQTPLESEITATLWNYLNYGRQNLKLARCLRNEYSRNPPQFSRTDDKPNHTVDVCAENVLELSIRAALMMLWYYRAQDEKLADSLYQKYKNDALQNISRPPHIDESRVLGHKIEEYAVLGTSLNPFVIESDPDSEDEEDLIRKFAKENQPPSLILDQVRRTQHSPSTGNSRALEHRDSEPEGFMMSGALPIGTQPEMTQTVDPEDDEEQIVTSRHRRTSRNTRVEQSDMGRTESENIAQPRHKNAFEDSISSLPSRIKLCLTACPFDHHGFLEFRINKQYVQYDRETNAFTLTKLFNFVIGQSATNPHKSAEFEKLRKLSFVRHWGEDKRGIHSKFSNSVCTYILLTCLVLPMADAKRWCESINAAAITDYVSAILDTDSSKGQILAKAFCSCGARIKLDSTGREHCKVQDITARRRGVSKGKVPSATHVQPLVPSKKQSKGFN